MAQLHWLATAVMVSVLLLIEASREEATSVYLAVAIAAAVSLPLVVLPSPVREFGTLVSGASVACSGALLSIHLGFPISEQGPSDQSMVDVLVFSLMAAFLALGGGRLQAMLVARKQSRLMEERLDDIRAKQDEIVATLEALTRAERSNSRSRWLPFW